MHLGFATSPASVLEEKYQQVYLQEMKGLPICNDDIKVEAVDFQLWEGHWVGVLITPWFTNLLIIRQKDQDWPEFKLGKYNQQEIIFPAGAIKFTPRFEPEIGQYLCCSLVSPMNEVASHEKALKDAKNAMRQLFTVPIEIKNVDCDSELNQDQQARRSFLQGKRKAAV